MSPEPSKKPKMVREYLDWRDARTTEDFAHEDVLEDSPQMRQQWMRAWFSWMVPEITKAQLEDLFVDRLVWACIDAKIDGKKAVSEMRLEWLADRASWTVFFLTWFPGEKIPAFPWKKMKPKSRCTGRDSKYYRQWRLRKELPVPDAEEATE